MNTVIIMVEIIPIAVISELILRKLLYTEIGGEIMANLIITISREYGSGGRLIGEKLSLELGIPFFDRAIIEMASEKSGLSADFIESSESRASNSFLFNLSTSLYASSSVTTQYDVPVNTRAYYAQASVVEDLAKKGSCIIVGRCADYILRDVPNCVKIFVHAPMEDRIHRAVHEYGADEEEIRAKIQKIDKARANYYRHFTNETWGSLHNYDLTINSSLSGIDPAVKMIKSLLVESKLI